MKFAPTATGAISDEASRLTGSEHSQGAARNGPTSAWIRPAAAPAPAARQPALRGRQAEAAGELRQAHQEVPEREAGRASRELSGREARRQAAQEPSARPDQAAQGQPASVGSSQASAYRRPLPQCPTGGRRPSTGPSPGNSRPRRCRRAKAAPRSSRAASHKTGLRRPARRTCSPGRNWRRSLPNRSLTRSQPPEPSGREGPAGRKPNKSIAWEHSFQIVCPGLTPRTTADGQGGTFFTGSRAGYRGGRSYLRPTCVLENIAGTWPGGKPDGCILAT